MGGKVKANKTESNERQSMMSTTLNQIQGSSDKRLKWSLLK